MNECTSSCRCCVVMSGEVRVGYRQGRSVISKLREIVLQNSESKLCGEGHVGP